MSYNYSNSNLIISNINITFLQLKIIFFFTALGNIFLNLKISSYNVLSWTRLYCRLFILSKLVKDCIILIIFEYLFSIICKLFISLNLFWQYLQFITFVLSIFPNYYFISTIVTMYYIYLLLYRECIIFIPIKH